MSLAQLAPGAAEQKETEGTNRVRELAERLLVPSGRRRNSECPTEYSGVPQNTAPCEEIDHWWSKKSLDVRSRRHGN